MKICLELKLYKGLTISKVDVESVWEGLEWSNNASVRKGTCSCFTGWNYTCNQRNCGVVAAELGPRLLSGKVVLIWKATPKAEGEILL